MNQNTEKKEQGGRMPMGFTTQFFLFIFFPLSILVYYVAAFLETKAKLFRKWRLRDVALVIFSLGFYMWSCFDDLFRLGIYIVLVYLAGVWIQRSRDSQRYLAIFQGEGSGAGMPCGKYPLAMLPLLVAVLGVLFCLISYKYTGLLAKCWNFLFHGNLTPKSIVAPLGISFITFSAVSYLADIYRGKANAGNLLDCALYLTFFPKVVSGPTVLWRDFSEQIAKRTTDLTGFTDGINRIMIGFAKKLILADSFGACIAEISSSNIDAVTAWGGALLYMLQLYFDFSGYSDIAIGLAKLFGFEVRENFNFPYRSCSISEFWRRWHISLGSWFREYVYFPLGGSRAGKGKTLRNLAVVFALTGIWHGAGWNYILWGAINGAFVLLERIVQDRPAYRKTPAAVKWASVMVIVLFFWQLFRFQDMSALWTNLKIMFGVLRFDNVYYTWQHYFDAQIITFAVIGILGSTVLGGDKVRNWYHRAVSTRLGFAVQQCVLLVLFAIAILFMVNSTYHPFIYFQY